MPRKAWAALLMLAVAGCMHAPTPTMRQWIRGVQSPGYQPLTEADVTALQQAFAAGMNGAPDTQRHWQGLGFDLLQAEDLLAVREGSPAQRGWGAFVFRMRSSRALLVQAPHAESDLGTGQLAWSVFDRTSASALALNSTSRAGGDQAHLPTGPFVLQTQAALATAPDLHIVQLHGFGEASATKLQLPLDSMVLSNGTREPDTELLSMAGCLRVADFDVRIYGQDVQALGGTRNAVAAVVRHQDRARFIHIEMGPALRRMLRQHGDRMDAFCACL